MPLRSRAAFSPERSCALNARNTPEHFRKKVAACSRPLRRSKNALLYTIAEKFCVEHAPGADYSPAELSDP